MIIGIGIDLVEIQRIEEASMSEPFLLKVFTDNEIAFFRMKKLLPQSIAGCFAAKEAVAKALGTGIGDAGWRDIEIEHGENSPPRIKLSGGALALLQKCGGEAVHISITHNKTTAGAVAVIEGQGKNDGY
ncbi:MAG: holo-ACP synthase [Bacillota bacterium]|nr:holo-ACP synthase [Bacillota bacterium]